MRIAILLGVVGVAGAAQAQTGSATWLSSVEISDDNTMATVTWSLQMEADTPFVALSATIFDSLITSGSGLGTVSDWSVKNELDTLTGDLTTTDGENLFNTNAGQLTLFGPFHSDNPIDVFCFKWTANDGVLIGDGGDKVVYETSTEALLLWAGDDKASATAVDVLGNLTEGMAMWTVVPAPASLALIGMGFLASGRRRR